MPVPIPVFSSLCDIWTGNAANTVFQALRQARVPCQVLSAFSAGARALVQNVQSAIGAYTHVVLFPAETDVRDDWIGGWGVPPVPIADYLALPPGTQPILRVVFVERRDLGSGNDYLRVYCQRGTNAGGAPSV